MMRLTMIPVSIGMVPSLSVKPAPPTHPFEQRTRAASVSFLTAIVRTARRYRGLRGGASSDCGARVGDGDEPARAARQGARRGGGDRFRCLARRAGTRARAGDRE